MTEYQWEVNIGSGNGLEPLPESMLTQIYATMWRHYTAER